MRFSLLCEAYQEIARTPKRLGKTQLIAQLLKGTDPGELEGVMLLLQGRAYPAWDKTTLGVSQKTAIKAIATASGRGEDKVVAEFKRLGDLGEVAATLAGTHRQATLASVELEVGEVVASMRRLATFEGAKSVERKLKQIAQLLSGASPNEARFVIRILLEDLRIGIADGTLRDALLWWQLAEKEHIVRNEKGDGWAGPEGVDVPSQVAAWQTALQDALDRSNDIARVARVAAQGGLEALRATELVIGTPAKVMLAQRSTDIADALARVGTPAAVEYKYDGFRMQVHRAADGTVTLFTRRLERVTDQFPDVVAAIKEHVKVACILDAEVVGYDPATKRHTAFQQISQRIRRKYEIEKLAADLPVEVHVFDVLVVGAEPVYHEPFRERRARIEALVPVVPQVLQPSAMILTEDPVQIEAFYKDALSRGYEGLMFKALDAPYRPGSRVGHMVKLKPTLDTLDLAVTGAEWGEGKRSGWLTSFVLACLDEDGELREIGRVGTGFKELEQEEGKEGITFAAMTDLLKDEIVEEHGKEVRVRPTVVLEVKFEEIQTSPSYGSGFALRFPRVVRVRSDRRTEEASTLGDVMDLFEAQRGRHSKAPAR